MNFLKNGKFLFGNGGSSAEWNKKFLYKSLVTEIKLYLRKEIYDSCNITTLREIQKNNFSFDRSVEESLFQQFFIFNFLEIQRLVVLVEQILSRQKLFKPEYYAKDRNNSPI